MGTGPIGSVFGENSSYRETWGTRRGRGGGGRHMAKRNSDTRIAYFRYGTQCELWVFLPPCQTGCRYPGKVHFIEPQGKTGTDYLCQMPPAARQTSGTGPCGDCRRVLLEPGPQSQYSWKIRFIENLDTR